MGQNRLVAELEISNFATKFNYLDYARFMILVYIIVAIAIAHALFFLYPVYRDEALDIYSWRPWTEKNYVLFKKAIGNNKAVKVRLLTNWFVWPFICLFTIVMPIVFLFKLPSILKEYDGEITYSQDGKTLLKVAENCRRVKIKKGVEVVGEGAFDSTRVRHIYLPNTIRIFEPNALLRAHYLESINLPVSLVKIDAYAFHFCGSFDKGLKKLILPKHLHTLGEGAFYGCNNMEQLTIRGDFVWKQSWMDNNPFYYTEKLSIIKNSNPNFIVKNGMLMSADGKILFRCVNNDKKIILNDGVETIAQGAFCGRNRMEKVIFPNSLRKICKDAFRGCRNIDNIDLPEGLLSIGVESFSFCWNLKTITLPASLKFIAYSAFEHSDHLKNIIYPIGKEEEFKKMIKDGMYDLPF